MISMTGAQAKLGAQEKRGLRPPRHAAGPHRNPQLFEPIGVAATVAGAAATLSSIAGWLAAPTALFAADWRATLGRCAWLQAPMLVCGVLMAIMLGAQRRGGKHTAPSVLWVVSRLNLFPTPAIYSVLDVLGARGYYHRVPMLEDEPAPPFAVPTPAAAAADAPLFVGGLPLPWHVLQLHAAGVRAVVNLCDEFGGWERLYASLGIEQLRLPTTDYMDVRADDLKRAVKFIDAQRARGRGVYVHCKAGVGRAGSTAVAYVAARAEHRLDAKRANAHVRKYRPVVVANLHTREGVLETVAWADARDRSAGAPASVDRAGSAPPLPTP